jgi:DNA repair photolyase
VEYIETKSIISRTKSPESWFGVEYNMNIYRGCHHGCIYCDSRSNCYHVEDFDTVRAKKQAVEMLANTLERKRKKGIIGTGAMSDPYNHFERQTELTRKAIAVITKHQFGLTLFTKSDLVTRDIDVLQKLQKTAPVLIGLSWSTPKDGLAKKIERNVSLPSKRFAAMEKLAKSEIYTGVLYMPILPYITDTEQQVREQVQRSIAMGAKFIYNMNGVTLRENQREHYYQWLDKLAPGMKEKYQRRFGKRYICESDNAKRIENYLKNACEKYNIAYTMPKIIAEYQKK